jgi:glycolate oxidase iron-sulfur subunit
MLNKTSDALLKDAEKIVSQCERCGTCLSACPLYSISNIERVGPRGKNILTRAVVQGGIELSNKVLEVVNFCLLCRSCVEACPSKVKTDEAMVNVRQYLANQGNGPGIKYKAVGGMLKSRSVVRLAARVLKVFRKAKLNKLVPCGMAPDEYTRDHFLSAFAGPAALGQTMPSDKKITNNTKVAYFYGCGMRMMFPEVSTETLEILKRVTHPIVKDNFCCGLPHFAHGLRNDYLELAKKNILLFEDVDVVVSDCASCSGTLKHIASYFTDVPDWKEKAEAFSRKIMDITEYLDKVGYVPRQRVEIRFTYHDSCHLARGQGIRKQPRQLLGAAGDFIEMKDAEMCCGGAGSFHMDYPDIAEKLLASKRERIENSGADVVVTSCPVCLVQMNKAAKASGGKFKAMHISQVI